MTVKFGENSILINGREYSRSYLERVLELPQGTLDSTIGNDPAIVPLLRIIGMDPRILRVVESGFDQSEIKEFEKAFLDNFWEILA